MTQVDLAKKAGITQPTLSDIETNKTRESFASTIIAIAAILDANIEWVQTGKGTPFGDPSTNDEAHDTLNKLTPRQVAVIHAMMRVLLGDEND